MKKISEKDRQKELDKKVIEMNIDDYDFRAVYKSVKEDCDALIKKDLNSHIVEDLKKEINKRVDEMHAQIDLKGEEFITTVVESFNSQKQEETTEKKDEKNKSKLSGIEKKMKEKMNKELDLINQIESDIEKKFQLSMYDVLNSLDAVINKTKVIEGSNEAFKDSNLENIISLGKDGFDIKLLRKLGKFLRSKKAGFDINWSKSNNKSYSSVSKDDEMQLNIKGTTCYTYYQTDKKFEHDEDFTIELEVKYTNSDNYFYLGLINQSVVPSSNCMCCTIANAFYIHPNGDIVLNAVRTNNPKLKIDKNKEVKIVFRVVGSEKEMYVTVDDKDEQGPFKISGKTFTFTSASCNTVTGYVRIENAFYN